MHSSDCLRSVESAGLPPVLTDWVGVNRVNDDRRRVSISKLLTLTFEFVVLVGLECPIHRYVETVPSPA
ncbi:hypothetical protein ABIB48_001724 [Arthrobacter sp. UYCu511]